SWVLSYMAAAKAGAVVTLLNGWWEANEMEHAVRLTEPRLIIADAARAERIRARCSDSSIVSLPPRQPVEQTLAELIRGDSPQPLPDVAPEDDATILFTSGSTGDSKGALSTHRAVTTGTYAYATALIVLRGLLEQEGN